MMKTFPGRTIGIWVLVGRTDGLSCWSLSLGNSGSELPSFVFTSSLHFGDWAKSRTLGSRKRESNVS